MSTEVYRILLPMCDILQVLDSLESKVTTWENTVQYADGGLVADEFAVVEEHKDAEDARAVLQHYRDLISKIQSQLP